MELSKKCLKRAKEGALGQTNFEAFKMRHVCRESGVVCGEFGNSVFTIPCKYGVLHTIQRN